MVKLPEECYTQVGEDTLCNFCGSPTNKQREATMTTSTVTYNCNCKGSFELGGLELVKEDLKKQLIEIELDIKAQKKKVHPKIQEERLVHSIKQLQEEFKGFSMFYVKDI